MEKYKLYDWQKDAFNVIKDKDAVLSAPTGSGKTTVALLWAGIYDLNLKYKNPENYKVFFTAPIKALSNQRYKNLTKAGLNVGIETGDIKENTNAPIMCVTQEIFTAKYSDIPNAKVIKDEFHYSYNNQERARAYIDAIVNTNKDSNILLISATFGNPDKLIQYLKDISQRDFVLYQTDYRPTKLIFMEQHSNVKEISKNNNIIFDFSMKGCDMIANDLFYTKKDQSKSIIKAITSITNKYNIKNDYIIEYAKKGIGFYNGQMIPKEKLATEELYLKGLINNLVATDALALGVNLPAEYVIFSTLQKYSGLISKNDFMQMAGRAGRKGFFDNGYVGFVNQREKTDFNYIINKKNEPINIIMNPDYKKILRNETDIKTEAEFLAKHSIPKIDYNQIFKKLNSEINYINKTAKDYNILDTLKDIYFNEFDPATNINAALLIKRNSDLNYKNFVNLVNSKSILYKLLQTRKFLNTIPHEYQQAIDFSNIDKHINQIDETILKVSKIS